MSDNNKNRYTMARFILDYDTTLNDETKIYITENCEPSMTCPNGNSLQFCLNDVIDFITEYKYLIQGIELLMAIDEDYDFLLELQKEGVNFIEICF